MPPLAVARHAGRGGPGRVAGRLGWAGLAGIVVACLRFNESTPWPGTAVLVPVLATMAVIVGGTGRSAMPWCAGPGLSARALQWIGRHSYALYLWHWPVMVLAAAHTGPLSWPQRVVVDRHRRRPAALSMRARRTRSATPAGSAPCPAAASPSAARWSS